MLMVLIFAIIGGIALTSWMYLMGARLQQAEHQLDQVTRNLVWGNSSAINQQYALGYAFRDNATQAACTALLNSGSWGGSDQSAILGFSAFRVLNTASNPSLWTYPFNNVRNAQTSDNSTFYVRTDGDSDSSQTEHVTFYNYEMSYPTPLMGDLLQVHTRPTGSTGATISKNLLVNGRTIIYDSTANVTAVKTTELLNLTKTGTNLALNTAGTTLMPTNFPSTPRFTAGYGGTGTPNAVLDGTLNVINNPNFTPGSIVDIMTMNGGYTNVSAGSASGSSSTAVQVTLQSTPTYAPPTTSPYSYTYTSPFNVVTVRLVPPTTSGNTPVLGHLRINGSVDQLVLQGQTTSTDWTKSDTLDPVIIWLEQEARDIRLVGENNRRVILVVGNGTGQVLYMGFSGTSLNGSSSPLRWRLHLINQYRNVYIDQPSGKNLIITGSIRTNWHINDTDTTSTTRITLQRETSPGTLSTLLPRDGWMAPYFVTQ